MIAAIEWLNLSTWGVAPVIIKAKDQITEKSFTLELTLASSLSPSPSLPPEKKLHLRKTSHTNSPIDIHVGQETFLQIPLKFK